MRGTWLLHDKLALEYVIQYTDSLIFFFQVTMHPFVGKQNRFSFKKEVFKIQIYELFLPYYSYVLVS